MRSPNFPVESRLASILEKRQVQGNLRKLRLSSGLVDFYSNDYLGIARSEEVHNLFMRNLLALTDKNGRQIGSTGSRLLSGNSELAEEIETKLAAFHNSESALLFNSGYDANLGAISAFIRPGDTVIYDELVHASMHDGMKLSKANCIPFRHNDSNHLEEILKAASGEKFILVETVYSMDGDLAPLLEICDLAEEYGASIIADEAHSTGIFGKNGRGLANELDVEYRIFARVITFSKALGTHGAAVLTTNTAKQYLINFARSFIYSTAASLPALLEIKTVYELLSNTDSYQKEAKERISFFRTELQKYPQLPFLLWSQSMIQALIIPNNFNALTVAQTLQSAGFDMRPLMYPTIERGKERIRICLHTHNSLEDIQSLLKVLDETLVVG